ncbi:MAG TPA: hypothetical protein VF668_01445 [Pyrinomonadaceae bacterium]|jgi:hypothetical protein
MDNVELGRRFLEEARGLGEQGHADAACVLLTLAGALLEGDHVVADLAQHSAQFCVWRDAVSQLPAPSIPPLIANAGIH